MAQVWKFFSHEDDYSDMSEEGACARLGRALSIKTVDGPTRDTTDWSTFDELEAHLRASFPLTFGRAAVEHVDHSLMLTISGEDPSLLPALFIAHMDVVPVVEGTEDDWEHDAFSGHVDDTYVWGRGALDMTDQLMGELEATEYALAHGWRFRRTLMLCFGQDEEMAQSGARAMGRLLEERGLRFEYLVDEGDYNIVDTGIYGAPGRFGMRVNLCEKGYADVRLTVRSAGGHSSNPFGGTSLATLSEAIARISRREWPVELIDINRRMLECLAPTITAEPLASLVRGGRAAIDANAAAIAREFASRRELYPFVTTTCAPTMIEGGSQQANVMPQDMSATINFRLLPGVTTADVLRAVSEDVAGLPVEVGLLNDAANDPSATSRSDGYGFRKLVDVASRYFVDPQTDEPLALIPAIVSGATDASMYERVCDTCMRFSAFVADADEVARGVHGTDERITRRAYLQGIRFFIRLIQETML